MKKKYLPKPAIILLLLSFFLLAESVWIIHLYQIEKKTFQNKINSSILSAIKEEAHAVRKKDPPCFMDLRKQGRVIMEYTLRGKHFRTDTVKTMLHPLLNRMLYDFYKETWRLDSMAHHYRSFSAAPEIPVLFVRKNSNGKIIDQFPAGVIPQRSPDLPPQLLGNTETDHLIAWYDFPPFYFWKYQKYGLLLSLLSLMLAIYYGILIIKKERSERDNLRFIEKQVIFIHDLKTPLCTNRDIEKRVLNNLENWPSEKIHEKLKVSRHQSSRLLTEMQKVAIQSAGHWGGEIENQNFNLKKVLEELVHNRQCEHEKARLSLDYQREYEEIFADPFHLLHMVDNLIGNALKYAGETANIHITCTSDEHYPLLISVKDNGPGIPSPIRKHIFRLNFFHNFRKNESHGLGLAYIRKIVRQYGGYVRVECKVNEGSEFRLAMNPDHSNKTKRIPSIQVYRSFFITLLLAEAIWLFNLYSTERANFIYQEKPLIDDAVFNVSKIFFEWQDTACFENNWQEKTITIVRGQKDTTVALGGAVNQSYVYQHLFYDLRDSRWSLDSVGRRYQQHGCTPAILLTRTDAAGKTIDRYPAEDPDILLPIVFHLPLGYVEGHQLKIELPYPWGRLLHSHKGWLLVSLAATLLSGWFTLTLSILTRRQQAMMNFQRKKVQHFIRELQTQLSDVLETEIKISTYFKNEKTAHSLHTLHVNIKQYENMLGKINYLLDQLMMISSHRLIFE